MFVRNIFLLLFFPMMAVCQPVDSEIQVIPQPLKVTPSEGLFTLQSDTKVFTPKGQQDWATAAEYLLLSMQSATGYKLDIQTYSKSSKLERSNAVYFLQDNQIDDKEGYLLEVKTNVITVRARTAAGAFYAIQTLRQLFPAEINSQQLVVRKSGWSAPCCTIEDAPRFGYRGLHLDVGRHFFPVSFVKKYIDVMAAHKLNTFHWHLTEDQGWRIEIKKYPRLQKVASCRKETLAGHYSDTPQRFDGVEHCGYYTQKEVKEVVEYAKKRFVTIIPEIEMPGHALAALAAYPALGCTGGPYETGKWWGVFDDVFCAGNEETFKFLSDVLEEVCALFPGTYFHIGGDECPKSRWEVCPKCIQRMKTEKLNTTHELQSYFIKRAESMLASHGKKLIGWDEILEGGIAPSATIMSWRGTEGGIAAVKAGHDAIMTPSSDVYFDYYQSDPATEPLAIGGYLPLEKVYAYEPIPAEVTAAESKHILGAQANIWTEYMQTTDQVEYMAYPRVCALAEVVWSSKAQRNWQDFGARLVRHFTRLDAMGLHYSKAFYDLTASFSDGKVSLKGNLPDFDIYYTTDGSTPSAASTRYQAPFPLTKTTTVKAVVVRQNKPAGKVLSITYLLHKASGKPYKMTGVPDKYTGGEQYGLTNGVVGSLKAFNNWVALNNKDMDPVIDLGAPTDINRVTTHFVNSKVAWIYPPKNVAVFVSDDGVKFKFLKNKAIDAQNLQGSTVETVVLDVPGARGRYVKVVAQTYGQIPSDAPGAGEGSWLFLDEIVVE